jgi:hypothetical protein
VSGASGIVPTIDWKLDRTSLTPCKLHNLNLDSEKINDNYSI